MRAARLASAATGVAIALFVADTAIVAAAYQLFSTRAIGIHGWPLVNLAALGCAGLGAVVLGTHPRHPIGWLLTVVGVAASVSMATESYSVWVLRHDGTGSDGLGQLAGWVAVLVGGPLALAVLTLVFLLVPDGRYLSPRWRLVTYAAGAGYLVFVLGLVVIGPRGVRRDGESLDAGPVGQALLSTGLLVIILAILSSVVALLLRLRRTTGAVRQQVRMVAVGAATVGAGLVALAVGQASQDGEQTWWTSVPLYLSYVFLVVCLAVAVLRYRLYDVEVIVGRAAALALATGLVAMGYVGVVVTLGRVLGEGAHAGFWPSLLAFVIVALAFQPVRRSVVRVADRLAYGERAAPYDALAELSRRIERNPAGEQLLPTIAAAARDAVDAEAVELVLGDASPGDGVVVPVADESGVLGSILLTLPPGRDVRPLEQRLLTDIAEQAALALRTAHLQLELAARVEQLDAHTRELAASRRRIIDAADTGRRDLEAEIGRRILPRMRQLRERVAAGRVEGCVDLATAALASLRELTRGIYPATLARIGLAPALRAHAARVDRADAVRIASAVEERRFPEPVETAAYFCCVEVLRQTEGQVGLEVDDSGQLVISLDGADLDGLDHRAIVDRVQACGGSLSPDSRRVRLPSPTPAGAGPG